MYEGQRSENQKFVEMYTRERGCENSGMKAIVACEPHQGDQEGEKREFELSSLNFEKNFPNFLGGHKT